jgi:hypothetical protein
MPDNKDFFPLRKIISRKKFLVLFGFGSATLITFLKSPFGIFKKRIIGKPMNSSVRFEENPLSVKRNKV